MPTAVLSSKQSHNAKVKPRPNGRPETKKTRLIRRRGRERGAIHSDDELEREARSDSSSDDGRSSINSDSEDDDNGHSPALTPSTTQSPQPDDKPLTNELDSHNNSTNLDGAPSDSFAPNSWSEMALEDDPWGSAQPPVVDFTEMDKLQERSKSRSYKGRKGDKKAQHRDEPAEVQVDSSNGHSVPSSSNRGWPPPSRGRSAREAYQSRLQSDPSFVPTVGEFWGHDDRLLDKDLRSLSGWWRRRGNHGGRGGFPPRGRGGRVFFSGRRIDEPDPQEEVIPPTERTWGHDGFEEMKKREEQRRIQAQQQKQELAPQGPPYRGTFRGGRGGHFVPRGRGGFGRGAGSSSPRLHHIPNDRPWFAMKPERMWTKQLDLFLHYDPSLKPRPGQGQGYRVKLAGSKKEQVVRTPLRRFSFAQLQDPATTTQSDIPHDNEEKTFVVRFPVSKQNDAVKRPSLSRSPERKRPSPVPIPAVQESEESLEEVFTVKPRTVPATIIPESAPPVSFAVPDTAQIRAELVERAVVRSPPPATALNLGSEQGDLQDDSKPQMRPTPPVLPPIRTVFTPLTPQPQPDVYRAPYAYAPTLPPGIAMNAQGMTYEIASGRPVYLQPTPPPLYDPRPVMAGHIHHGVPFVPGHLHQSSSSSSDYLSSHSRAPSMTGFVDPVTGMPIFSPPRQNSRIEIRRPADSDQLPFKSPKEIHRPSGLRTTVSALEAADPAAEDQIQNPQPMEYYPSIADYPAPNQQTEVDESTYSGVQHGIDPTLVAYQHYQAYYYPEYAYPSYPPIQYDMYQDQHNSQPAIYY